MPKGKDKSPERPKKAKASTPRPKKTGTPTATKENYTDEYRDYLVRYELYGEGRPRLSPADFDRYDDELLDLLDQEWTRGSLDDEQVIRKQELEFLLLDSEQ